MTQKLNPELKQNGIYKITNTVNGKIYVGCTFNTFQRRWSEHKRFLKENKHRNKPLQNSFNKYGIEKFIFEVIEIVEINLGKLFLRERELYWINFYNCLHRDYGFNIIETDEQYINEYKFYLVQYPKEKEYKLIKNLKKFAEDNNLNIEILKKVLDEKIQSHKGFKVKHYKGIVNKRIDNENKIPQYLVTFPDSHQEEVCNLSLFCHQHEIERSNLLAVARGKRISSEGFKCEYLDKTKYKKHVARDFKEPTHIIIDDENGKEYLVNNIRKWCRDNGWEENHYKKLKNTIIPSKMPQYKKHRCYPIKYILEGKQEYPKCNFIYKVITDKNKIYFVDSLTTVADYENIHFKYLYDILNNNHFHYLLKDWQVIKL